MKIVMGRDIPTDPDELFARARNPALLMIDVQNDFAHADGHFARSGSDLRLIEQSLPAMKSLLDKARAAGLAVVHVHQSTLPDGLSDSDAWLHFKTRTGRSPDYCLPGSWGAAPVSGFEARSTEPVVIKFRPDAFLGTALDRILAAGGHQTVVVAGLFTEGCVESTVRSASYRDHFVVVAEDAVASAIADRHAASLGLMRERYSVFPAAELLDFYRQARNRAAS